MKTAISVPDALHESIESFIQATGMTRSEFYQRAARAYMETGYARAIAGNLDRVHGGEETAEEISFRRAALSHFRDLARERNGSLHRHSGPVESSPARCGPAYMDRTARPMLPSCSRVSRP